MYRAIAWFLLVLRRSPFSGFSGTVFIQNDMNSLIWMKWIGTMYEHLYIEKLYKDPFILKQELYKWTVYKPPFMCRYFHM